MRIVFPALEPWQQPVYDDVHTSQGTGNVYVVKSKRQVGKSCLAALLLIEFGLVRKCISVVVEPTQAQSRRLFKQIADMMQPTGVLKSANSQLLTMEFSNGSEILFKSAEQRDALRGFTVSGLLVIDEAAFIQDAIFEILYPTCDANNAPILIISTPLFCSGEFYNQYMRGISGGKHIKSYDWSAYDTSKYLSPEKLQHYRETISPLKFKSEYLGEFISEGSYIFGDINNCIYSGENKAKPVFAGIDWGAGNGGDWTVMIMMDALGVVTRIVSFNDIGPVEQIEKLAGIIKAYPTIQAVCVEINSIGAVYYDMLRKKIGDKVRKFNTTNESKRNIIEQLISAFQTSSIGIPYDEELILELQHYTAEKTPKGGLTYNGADGVHDDYVIALALVYDAYMKKYNSRFVFGMA